LSFVSCNQAVIFKGLEPLGPEEQFPLSPSVLEKHRSGYSLEGGALYLTRFRLQNIQTYQGEDRWNGLHKEDARRDCRSAVEACHGDTA
jgi:hypothetical protein